MSEQTTQTIAYKKFKSIPTPSWYYLAKNTKRNRLELQVELLKDFGPIVRLPSLTPTFIINHPDYVKHILLSHHTNYIKSDENYAGITEALGPSIVTNNGDEWKNQRHSLSSFFHPQHIHTHYTSLIQAEATALRSRIQRYADNEQLINLTLETRISLIRLAGKLFLSSELDSVFIKQLIDLSKSMNFYVGKGRQYLNYIPIPSTIQLRLLKRKVDRHLRSLVFRRRKEKNPPQDLLTQLLLFRDKNHYGLNETQLLGELKTILTANHESLTHALSWTMYELIRHPDILQTVKDELSYKQEKKSYPYLKQVIEESLRLNPPAWITTRTAVSSDDLDGYFIPAGSKILICSYAIHRHPAYWSNPDAFDPSHFSEANKKEHVRFSYFPFGGGPRMCIGSYFAMHIAELFLQALLPYFNFEIMNKGIEPEIRITLGIKNGLLLRVTS